MVEVEVDHGKFTRSVPSRVGNIPVKTVPKRENSLNGCTVDIYENPVPGGLQIGTATNSNGKYSFGTTFGAVSKGGTRYMMTVAHIWDACQSDPLGKQAYIQRHPIGTVQGYNSAADYLIVSPGSKTFSGNVQYPDGYSYPIGGWFTGTGVANLIYQASTVHKIGVTTGMESGTVFGDRASYDPTCINFDGYGVNSTCVTADGDSGGPIFQKDSNDLIWMINSDTYGSGNAGTMNCGGNTVQKYSQVRGTAFYHLHNSYGFTTGTTGTSSTK